MASSVATKRVVEDSPPATAAVAGWKSMKLRSWIALGILLSLLIHTILYLAVRPSAPVSPIIEPEFTVGTFTLAAGDAGLPHFKPAKFTLHIRLLDETASEARERLVTHKFRVREAVENLLRKAQGTDLDEPALARLKRQIQEQINTAIELPAVAEVIVTDLEIAPRREPDDGTPVSKSL